MSKPPRQRFADASPRRPTPRRTRTLDNAWANAALYRTLIEIPGDVFAAPSNRVLPRFAVALNHTREVDLYCLDALEGGLADRSA